MFFEQLHVHQYSSLLAVENSSATNIASQKSLGLLSAELAGFLLLCVTLESVLHHFYLAHWRLTSTGDILAKCGQRASTRPQSLEVKRCDAASAILIC